MNEIENKIYLYQCFKNIFLSMSIFCLIITVWLYYSWKSKENLKIFVGIFLLGVVGSFICVQQIQASSHRERPVVLKMKEGMRLKYTKIYDRDDFRVFQNSQTGDTLENLEDIEIEGVEQSDEVFVRGLEGILEEKVKDVVEEREIGILLTRIELGGKDAFKYKVDLERNKVHLDGVITIKKRKINLRIAGGSREYGHYNEIIYDQDIPVGENTESYVNCEIEGVLKGDAVSYPTPCEKPIEEDWMPDYPKGEWKDRITINQDGEAGKNYYFNDKEIVCGTLKIEPEIIEDYSQYIDFETDRKQVYFDKDTGKLWADGKTQDFCVQLKESEKGGFYTDVCMDTGEIISRKGKGLDFSKENFKEGEEQKICLYLVHEENQMKSEPFTISLFFDTCAPEVTGNTISDRMNDYETLSDIITIGKYYGQEKMGRENFYLEDKNGCGIKESWYHVIESEEDFTKEMIQNYLYNELQEKQWNLLPQDGVIEFSLEQEKYLVLIKVEDYLGHEKIYVSNKISIDREKPHVQIKFGKKQQISKTGIYGEDVKLEFFAKDEKSAIAKMEVLVTCGGKEIKKDVLIERATLQEILLPYTIVAQENYSGDVCVTVIVSDYAGNRTEKKLYLEMDTVLPEVKVQWNTGKNSQKKYYNTERVAHIEIKEKNFEDSLIQWEIKGNAKIEKWKSKGDFHFCDVVFSKDGVYGLEFSCVDQAGNQKKYQEPDTFIIDRTSPVIEVTYEDEIDSHIKYFNRPRVAEIVIYEQNFDENQVEVSVKNEKMEGKQPHITEFSSQKGVHRAKVLYEESGEYDLKVSCGDKAGNQAKDFQSEKFILDLEIPEIEIFNVKDKSANKDKVAPIIEIRDVNYQMGAFTVELLGSNGKSLKINKTVRGIKQGQRIAVDDLPRTEEVDDAYTLLVTAVDKAGNWVKKEIMFSVNRYGSIYELDPGTQKWLSVEERNHTYLKEGKEIGIYEYNVDRIKERIITVICDGELKNLKEGQDYRVETLENKGKWKKSYYKIKAENFKREGNYTVILNSKDNANNSMNNICMKRKAEVMPISFTVDYTSPAVFIRGVENRGKYQDLVKDIVIEVTDNQGLEEVELQIGNRKIQYKKKELKEKKGIIKEKIYKNERWQKIQVTAIDAAKNKHLERLRVLVMPNSLQKEKMQDNTMKIMLVFLLPILLFVWKKKKS